LLSGWRQARAIALLPGAVAVLLPAIILIVGDGPNVGWGISGLAATLPALLGAVLIIAGFTLWLWTVRLFARIGKGTLAPWDPTQRLVVIGPYAHVRNPMISAVLAVLLGEAALFGSPGLLILAAAFLVANHAFFLLHEEPGLERRFGEEYRAYKRAVPRWIPRRRPWVARLDRHR
jgi:protein-S-isoprenylcysteine O-methyltransferase Ste14